LSLLVFSGINFVPLGYREPAISNEEKIVGGSPYGASSVAGGKGTLAVLDEDKQAGRTQGKSFAEIVNTFVRGRDASA
jgi:NAD(P)H dehydrogenase (quinone)